jgi:hypothetical protein
MLTYKVLIGCAAAYFILVVVDAIRRRSLRVLFWQIAIGILINVLAYRVLLSTPPGAIGFGPSDQVSNILAIGLGAVLGIAARYIFELKQRSQFDWFALLKPLCISPIVVLPLMATSQGEGDVKPFQEAMFFLLSFQNGFFWQAVLEQVRARLAKPTVR